MVETEEIGGIKSLDIILIVCGVFGSHGAGSTTALCVLETGYIIRP